MPKKESFARFMHHICWLGKHHDDVYVMISLTVGNHDLNRQHLLAVACVLTNTATCVSFSMYKVNLRANVLNVDSSLCVFPRSKVESPAAVRYYTVILCGVVCGM